MAFDLEELFRDVFAPGVGETVTIMHDIPHGKVEDTPVWKERRLMAGDWYSRIFAFSPRYHLTVNPVLVYEATGLSNSDLPSHGLINHERHSIEEVVSRSTIVMALTEFSASAPLIKMGSKFPRVRIASMPGVSRAMEETALSADFKAIAATCRRLAPLFREAVGIEVQFSSGHRCYFDTSNHNRVCEDNGLLPSGLTADANRFANLPAGELCTCPNEKEDSLTAGEIPAVVDDEFVVFLVDKNQVEDVVGTGPVAVKLRHDFASEAALGNIAEVAIGCNPMAVVTGNVLEDEKAGFHWAFGRSDHLGGTVGVDAFSSPDKVDHRDLVYAKGSPVVCSRLDFVTADGDRKTAIIDGELEV